MTNAALGWITTALQIATVYASFRVASRRGETRRLLADAGLVLLSLLLGAAATFGALLLIQPRWGWGWIVLGPLVTALGATPCLMAGLYIGERFVAHAQPAFRFGPALASLIGATLVCSGFAVVLFNLINGPGGGSSGGWEMAFVPLCLLTPIQWAIVYPGLYLLLGPGEARARCVEPRAGGC